MMNEQKLKGLEAELAKGIKTEDDLNQFTGNVQVALESCLVRLITDTL